MAANHGGKDGLMGKKYMWNAARGVPVLGALNIPPASVKILGKHIAAKTRVPWGHIEAALPEGVRATAELSPQSLSLLCTFYHEEMGEIGRVKAVFSGEGMVLSKLFCRVRDGDDVFSLKRDAMMTGIYEAAKAAFG